MSYKIQVMKPSLPGLDNYFSRMERIWNSRILSNFAYYSSEMEKIISKYLGNNKVKIVSNADAGLIIALSILNLDQGSEVILSSFTFNSTANAVLWNNLKPVFADIEPGTFNLDPKSIEKKITLNTRVVLVTHVFGNPANIDELRKLCKIHNLYLIFDSAHAYGSRYKGKKIGTLADIDVFSFSGTKLVTSGEGGAVVSNSIELINKISLARNYGFSGDYNSKILGLNGKMSEMNAALGCLELPKVERYVKRRNALVKVYKTNLDKVGDIAFQLVSPQDVCSYKDFCILTTKRDKLAEYLENNGVQTKKYFRPIHKMDLYKKFTTSLPQTDVISSQCLCLPIFNDMTINEVKRVSFLIKEFFYDKKN